MSVTGGPGSAPETGTILGEQAKPPFAVLPGDKLLGGPQAGIIAGRGDLVAHAARNPIKRAVRLDKVRLAALEATLKLYRDPDRLPNVLPTLRFFVRPRADIAAVANRLVAPIAAAVGAGFEVTVDGRRRRAGLLRPARAAPGPGGIPR